MASFMNQYNQSCAVDNLMPNIRPNPGLQAIWKLDESIRQEFDGAIQMYQQGLVHSVEFFQSLNHILHRERT